MQCEAMRPQASEKWLQRIGFFIMPALRSNFLQLPANVIAYAADARQIPDSRSPSVADSQ
jgi:hypothetical protein